MDATLIVNVFVESAMAFRAGCVSFAPQLANQKGYAHAATNGDGSLNRPRRYAACGSRREAVVVQSGLWMQR